MATTYADIHIKVKSDVKDESEKVLNQIGISMTDLINMTLRRVIREKQIPFSTRVGDELPENLRIESKEQLMAILDEQTSKDKNDYLSEEETWARINQHRQAVKERALAHA